MTAIRVKGLDSPVQIKGDVPTEEEHRAIVRTVNSKRKFTGMAAPKPKTFSQQAGAVAGQILDPFGTGMGVLAPAAAMVGAVEHSRQQTEAERKARADEISTILKGDFDPGSAGVSDILLRADISRSSTLQGITEKFVEAYPQGSIGVLSLQSGETVVITKQNENELWRALDPPGMDWPGTWGDILGGALSEPVILGMAGAIVGGPILSGVMAAVGSGIKHGVEAGFHGTDVLPSATDMLIEAGIEGIAATTGEGVIRYGGPMAQAAKRIASRGNARLYQAADELGLPSPVIRQTGRSPVTRLAWTIAGRTSPVVENTVTRQSTALRLSLERRAGLDASNVAKNNLDKLSIDELDQLVALEQQQIGHLLSGIEMGRVSRHQGFEALERGIEKWRQASDRLVRRTYAQADNMSEDISYNVAEAQNVLRDIARGVWGKGRATAGHDMFGPDVPNQAIDVLLSGKPPKEVQSLLDDILALDPVMAKHSAKGGEWTAWQQIKALRTRSWNMKMSDDPVLRGYGKRIWSELTKVMDNPISGNPEFVAKWRQASQLYRRREEILEYPFIIKALDSRMLPEDFAKQFMQPGNTERLQLIKSLIPKPEWETFRQAFLFDLQVTAMARGGNALRSRLKAIKADDDYRQLLMSDEQLKQFENFANVTAQFDSSEVMRLANEELSTGQQALAMARVSPAQTQRAIMGTGGIDGRYATAARAAVFQRILDGATELTRDGSKIINPGKLLARIRKEKGNENLQHFFRDEDWAAIENYELYTIMLSRQSDVGASLQAAELTTKVTEAPYRPLAAAAGLRAITKNHILALTLAQSGGSSRLAAGAAAGSQLEGAGAAIGLVLEQLGRPVQLQMPN